MYVAILPKGTTIIEYTQLENNVQTVLPLLLERTKNHNKLSIRYDSKYLISLKQRHIIHILNEHHASFVCISDRSIINSDVIGLLNQISDLFQHSQHQIKQHMQNMMLELKPADENHKPNIYVPISQFLAPHEQLNLVLSTDTNDEEERFFRNYKSPDISEDKNKKNGFSVYWVGLLVTTVIIVAKRKEISVLVKKFLKK